MKKWQPKEHGAVYFIQTSPNLRSKRIRLTNDLHRVQHDLAMLENATGNKKDIKQNLIKQAGRRNQALSRVTSRMIHASELSEEYKVQLDRALRVHKERKRDKSRRKDLGLDMTW